MRKKYLICERASKVQINLLKSCKLSSQSSLPKLIFFIALKSMMHFYIKHIYHQPTPPLITHRCDIQCPFISLISNIVLLLYYNTGCSIQIWLFWHDNKYLGIELRGGGGGSYGHSNCCCCCSSSVIALCVVKSEKIFNLP